MFFLVFQFDMKVNSRLKDSDKLTKKHEFFLRVHPEVALLFALSVQEKF